MSVEEVAEKLNTDPISGLDGKEAASRREVRNDGSAFTFPQLSASDAARLVLNDVTLYFLFFLIAIIFSLFRMWAVSIVALAIVILNCLLTVSLKITANRYENLVLAPTIPRVNVRRSGKLYSVEGRNVVCGDLVLLTAGDILPCDIRIVASENLVLSESVSEKDGKKEYKTARKFAGTLPENSRLHINEVSNMLFAGGIILSGRAVGIAVACGKNTYAAKRFSGVELRSSETQSRADRNIGAFFRGLTNILFAIAIPFSLVSLFFGEASVSPLEALSQTSALAASLPLQTIVVLYSTVVCCALRYASKASDKYGRNAAVLKNHASVERLNNASKLFMLGEKTLLGNGRCVESLYVNLDTVISSEDVSDPTATKELLEYAYLINKAATEAGKTSGVFRNNESVLLRAMKDFSVDCERIIQSGTVISYKRLQDDRLADVAIVSEGSDLAKKSVLVCRAFDDKIIELADWYTSNGVDVKLDDTSREELKNEYLRLKELGYDIISIARSAPRLYDYDSLEYYDDQLIFAGIVAVGPSYSRQNAESVKALSEQGLSPVLVFDEESEENINIVKNLFKIMQRPINVVSASDLASTGYTLEDYPDADAYLGFSKKEICDFIGSQRRRGVICATAAVDFEDIKTVSNSNFVISYSNDTLKENACTEPYPDRISDVGASSPALKMRSDMTVLPVNVRGGGLDGILHALLYVRSFFSNLERAVSYLIASLIMRALAVYLPIIFGRPSMNAAMILYLGCIVDLAAVLFISFTGVSFGKKRDGSSSFTSIKSLIKSNISSVVYAALNGFVIACAGLIIPKENNEILADYLFIALLLVQLSVFVYAVLKNLEKITPRDVLRALTFAAAVFVVTVLIGLIPGVSTVFGIASTFGAWFRASVVFVICALIGFVSLKDRFFA